jgi:hypothetical protein
MVFPTTAVADQVRLDNEGAFVAQKLVGATAAAIPGACGSRTPESGELFGPTGSEVQAARTAASVKKRRPA